MDDSLISTMFRTKLMVLQGLGTILIMESYERDEIDVR
jgi:hypothetical protein